MLICIGGVCVPYTAVIPLAVLALKWVAVQLASLGLLPKAAADLLHIAPAQTKAPDIVTASGPETVKTLESQEDFDVLLKNTNQKVVCKFTAEWCKPCHRIQPFYGKLSAQYKDEASFLTIDVDDFDAIAGKYKVAMMPTFVVVKGDQVLGRYSGSNEHELQQFLKEHLASS